MMKAWPAIRSVLWKFLYGVAVVTVAYLKGWLDVNQNIEAWTLASITGGLLTALFAFGKDFLFRVALPAMFGSK